MTADRNPLNNPSSKIESPIVGIGASAGGLDPLRALLEAIPENTGLSFVIIQHLTADKESLLPEILSRSTKMTVVQVLDNMSIQANRVYVMPPGTTMTLQGSYFKLAPREVANRPINAFFTSLSSELKTKAIGIVLSGTGNDGTEGLKAIKAEGGITFAQDPKTAQYPDMPQNAIASDSAYFVLSPEDIAKELTSIAKHPQLAYDRAKAKKPELTKTELGLKKILSMIKSAFNIDFSHYKENTINRRITRRMVINKIENIDAYVPFLKANPKELQALFDDFLIGVTSFFREPKTFDLLKEKVFPEITKNGALNIMRVWVPGCSTGEEVYSLAIAIREFLEDKEIVDLRVQVFGTDANEKSIDKARKGIYPKAIEESVSPNRLKRFFEKNSGNYQITKPIRDMCVFARQDLTVDPPFSNLDLIVCRNLLIYFDSHLQERTLPIFHYGLKVNGFLVLGESESIGKFQYLFEPISPKSAVFRKRNAQPQVSLNTETVIKSTSHKPIKTTDRTDRLAELKDEVDRELMEQYTPAALLVNTNLDALFFRGQVNSYLTLESGTASLNVNKIVRKEFRAQVETAIYRVRKENKPFTETVQVNRGQQTRTVEIQVKPFRKSQFDESFFLITFVDVPYKAVYSSETVASADQILVQQNRELKEDLESTKQSLQTIVEAHEATTEELRSAMEEAQSSNEELQSTNEELETAKEELQSSNEELTTLNEELTNRNQDLSEVNDDLINLMANVDTTVVIVDGALRIKRFTPLAQELLKIGPKDVGRLITGIILGVQVNDLEKVLHEVTRNLSTVKQEIAGENGRFYELRVRPYLTSEKKIDGTVLSFVDVTERRILEREKAKQTTDLESQVKDQAAIIVQSERLATIGETAGMVGHDLRNPLQTITGEVFLAKGEVKSLPEGEQKKNLQESIGVIEEQIGYMDKIVSDLQMYVKRVEVDKQEIKVKPLIMGIMDKTKIPKNIQTSVQLEESLTVEADPLLLKRVLVNLVTNAVQAMPKGGHLIINARVNDNNQMQIDVGDTGVGIPEEVKPKLFVPLFTTKSRGQGFGLAVCKRVIEAHGGTIDFTSQEGKGTTFTIKLPKKS
jgi:two-component system, chemotaxis family, CheB/CheR fusion protein